MTTTIYRFPCKLESQLLNDIRQKGRFLYAQPTDKLPCSSTDDWKMQRSMPTGFDYEAAYAYDGKVYVIKPNVIVVVDY